MPYKLFNLAPLSYDEVLPFKGTRYSVIFYQLEPAFAVDLTSTEEGGGVGGAAAVVSARWGMGAS